MQLSIVVPAHNEEDNIVEVIRRIEGSIDIPHELIIVNDHSTDATAELVRQGSRQYPHLRLLENKGGKGFAQALKTGFAEIKTEVVIPVMGDLSDDLSSIKAMFHKINEGYDIVCGARYVPGGGRLGGSKVKGLLSHLAGVSLHYLLAIPTSDISNAFKMYRKKVIESTAIQARGFEISMEIPLKAYYLGFKITEVPTVWKERTRGKSSFRIFRILPSYLRLYLWAISRRFIPLGTTD